MDNNSFRGYQPRVEVICQSSPLCQVTTLPSSDVPMDTNIQPPYNLVIPVPQSSSKLQNSQNQRTSKAKSPAIFECDIFGCNTAFKTKFSLQRHYKKHYSQKELKCRFCTKSFCLSQYKEEHEYTHTGEKPFVCSMCPSRFRQRGKLSHHRKVCPNRPELSMQQQHKLLQPEQQKISSFTMQDIVIDFSSLSGMPDVVQSPASAAIQYMIRSRESNIAESQLPYRTQSSDQYPRMHHPIFNEPTLLQPHVMSSTYTQANQNNNFQGSIFDIVETAPQKQQRLQNTSNQTPPAPTPQTMPATLKSASRAAMTEHIENEHYDQQLRQAAKKLAYELSKQGDNRKLRSRQEWLEALHKCNQNSFLDLLKQEKQQMQGPDNHQMLSHFRTRSTLNAEDANQKDEIRIPQSKSTFQQMRDQLIDKCLLTEHFNKQRSLINAPTLQHQLSAEQQQSKLGATTKGLFYQNNESSNTKNE